MRYAGVVMAGLVAAVFVYGVAGLPARGVRAAGVWGRATGVPGLAVLAADGVAEVGSVSCPSQGNCAVAGGYADRAGRSQGFVAGQRNGRWGRAIAIPGLRALNAGGLAVFISVSCASAGNCAVGGGYKDGSGNEQGFVASERRGVWGKAIEVPGLGALNAGGVAGVVSVSCAPPGGCAVTGFYLDGSGSGQGFVASQRNGRWGKAIAIPGLAALNDGGGASGVSVSCPAAGGCVVGGEYADGGDTVKGFVANQRNGRWGKAVEVPGLAALDADQGDAGVTSLSCGSAGNCTAGGFYQGSAFSQQGFVASESGGRWGKTIEVPGLAALNPHGIAEVNSVSCPSAGNCAAAGDYRHDAGHDQGFVVSQRHGRWGKAIEVPGLAALNAGGFAEVSSVSCASAGNCAAAGYYRDRSGHQQGFVASQRNGRWGKAIEVPGLAQLNRGGNAQTLAVSCAPAGGCTAGGFYPGRSRHTQGFVVSQHNP